MRNFILIMIVAVIIGLAGIKVSHIVRESYNFSSLPIPIIVDSHDMANFYREKKIDKVEEKRVSFLQDIEVIATFILDNDAIALIRELDVSKDALYRLYDTIKGSQIIEISLERVVFLKDGKKETLVTRTRLSIEEPIQEITPYYRVVNKSLLAQKVSDINVFNREEELIPFIEGGKIRGFKILQLREGGILAKAGLKQDDVVRSINGVRLTNLKEVSTLLEMVRSSNIIQIDVEIDRYHSRYRRSPDSYIFSYTVF